MKNILKIKLILAASILAGLLLLKLITPERYTGYDGGFYRAMSRELVSPNTKTTTASYCYRILPAWLLHFLPLETETAFLVYNAVIGSVSAYLLFFLFLDSGYSLLESSLGTFFFFFSWINVRLHLFYPILVDATYYLIIILAFWALLRKNDSLFLVSLTLGALTRENFFSLIPVYYFHRKEKGRVWNRKVFIRTLCLAAGPVALFFLLRLVIPNTNPDFSYLKNMVYFSRMSFIYRSRVVYSYFNIYGVVMFIIILHLPTVLRFLWRNSYLSIYLLVSVIAPLFTGWDISRYNFFSFPVILILALQAMKEHRNIYRNKLMVAFLVVSQLYLMRILRPMSTENYRRIWWSNISFCPHDVFVESSQRFALFALAFIALYSILHFYMRKKGRHPPSRMGTTF